jgi:chromosomal replication initiator protein
VVPSSGLATQAEVNLDSAVPVLNPKYTFHSFVVGPSNQFAQAAAWAVATTASPTYNPLYLYGIEGIGKTHLMNAIAQQLKDNHPERKVIYISSEQFMRELINSLRYGRIGLFRQHFRSADALLVDDIQLLGSTEVTQEEFFETFNVLYLSGKQIVISCDRRPKEISGLPERICSRLEWGLMADIEPPELETRMAILDRKAEEEGLHLPEDVRSYMATEMKSNVSELQRALSRLAELALRTNVKISISLAERALTIPLDKAALSAPAEEMCTPEPPIVEPNVREVLRQKWRLQERLKFSMKRHGRLRQYHERLRSELAAQLSGPIACSRTARTYMVTPPELLGSRS